MVQQKQGLVKPTMQMKGNVNVNDDTRLEKEADQMGAKASQVPTITIAEGLKNSPIQVGNVLQPVWIKTGKGNKWVDDVDTSKFEITEEIQDGDKTHSKGQVYRQKKIDKAGGKAARVEKAHKKKEGETEEVQEELVDKSKEILEQSTSHVLVRGTKVYRMTDALTARKYALTGLPRSMNHKDGEEWLQLGPGFYTSQDPDSVKHYASKLGEIDPKLRRFEIRGMPVMLEITLTSDANGIAIGDPEKAGVDSAKFLGMKGVIESTDCIHHVDESDPPQTKFHSHFMDKLQITACHVKEGSAYKIYDPAGFVRNFECYMVEKHKVAAVEQFPPRDEKEKVVEPFVPSLGLTSAKDAEEWEIEAIQYADLAAQFERNIGIYCSRSERAHIAIRNLVSAVWKMFSGEVKDLLELGSKRPGVTGGVWSELQLLQGIVDSGNLREQLSLLYNGYANRLFEKLNDNKRLERPDFFIKEREDRRPTGIKNKKTDQNPLSTTPELSRAEWLTAVNKEGMLTWEPGEKVFEFQMKSEFQKMSENIGALVMTGASGTAYGILQSAKLIGEKHGFEPDLLGVRIGLLGWMIPARDHTFHEIMTACALFDSKLTYQDGYRRYRSLLPFNEEELRNEVAPNKMFPDEMLKTLREI